MNCHQKRKKNMHLLFSPVLASAIYIGGGGLGLVLLIIVIVLVLRR
jgi:cellobiose-specific phosphotransferase system component IIC